jgi:hypothetical protein
MFFSLCFSSSLLRQPAPARPLRLPGAFRHIHAFFSPLESLLANRAGH